jgi:mannose-6-phosphate isomerase-like protein (cupin superfamily)
VHHIAIGDADSYRSAADVFKPLSSLLDTDGLALNYFELEPGDAFGFCYHRHHEQEEVFYVQSGTATFETEDGTAEVGPGEVVRFAPGEWQRGTNRGTERVVALALGAPREQGPTDLRRVCETCDKRTPHEVSAEHVNGDTDDRREAVVTTCLTCGSETGRFTD